MSIPKVYKKSLYLTEKSIRKFYIKPKTLCEMSISNRKVVRKAYI